MARHGEHLPADDGYEARTRHVSPTPLTFLDEA
jgi:hypothetical protein